MSTIETLYTDDEHTQALYPRTKVEAISNNDGEMLNTLLGGLEVESVWSGSSSSMGSTSWTLNVKKTPIFLVVKLANNGGVGSYYNTAIITCDGATNLISSVRFDSSTNINIGRGLIFNPNTNVFSTLQAYYGTAWNSMSSVNNAYLVPVQIWAIYSK